MECLFQVSRGPAQKQKLGYFPLGNSNIVGKKYYSKYSFN